MFCLKKMSFAGIIVLMLFLYGCSDNNGAGTASSIPSNSQSPSSTASNGSDSSQTRTVKDAKGQVDIPVNPKRIVDISGSTEELIVLGLRPVLTGNTDMANPAAVTPILKKELGDKVGVAGWFQTEVSVEAILSANPDLILAGPTQEKIYEQLQQIAPTVRVPYGFNAFRGRFAFVAEVLGKKAEMEAWLKTYDERSKQLHEHITAVTKQETFAVIEATEKEIRIYSSTGIADMIFQDLKLPKAPGTPDPDPWGGKVTNLEGLSTLNPDHLILLANNENNVLEQSKIWSSLKAMKAGNVYRMTSRQNYNEAFFAIGKQSVLEQISGDILKHAK
ncbi:ABC transporter substrate-binding protein [Paenibacillus ferrarius]|uniref:ABC transporter substrate-binding protein n=1 Tax=Paenibacillus ferrarius TaxID=1469647 RepID=A0A1V4HRV1_9BACL|nr:ABC transporter substrate-binding protein [Paenibacillus ferrarius]OPH61395.1 ABC transporter substrate-binding protein [Paenibacillus ferrarius]